MAEEEQKTIVLVTGGFDPLHSGHIAYLEEARQLGDTLIVGLNSDAWLTRKKGRAFMPVDERGAIIDALGCVDKVIGFDEEYDADNSACKFIKDMLEYNPKARIIFANGGDRKTGNIPEESVIDSRLMFAQSVGGDDKKNAKITMSQERNPVFTAPPPKNPIQKSSSTEKKIEKTVSVPVVVEKVDKAATFETPQKEELENGHLQEKEPAEVVTPVSVEPRVPVQHTPVEISPVEIVEKAETESVIEASGRLKSLI